ncbi:MAG: DUF3412 domain-containing protein [Sinobacterium sp.]|nr:DUF3412 domain-containing protein [Sinobacterium sp.]
MKVARSYIRPSRSLQLLSRQEIDLLMESTKSTYQLFRRCVLAILSSNPHSDDAAALLEIYYDFKIRLVVQSRGIRLDLYNAPANAFVDGVMIQGLKDQVFSALRDIVFFKGFAQLVSPKNLTSAQITDQVFLILRNANIVRSSVRPNLAVCWGGHSISRGEYDYTKEVGYHLGLRGIDVATGSGPGAMKGPMKGAAVGHSKQQLRKGRYIGVTEPGIIAAESPNMLVNELVILPDIEKRLEAFVRMAHVLVVFPGGVGTAEEVLYILSIKMQEENQDMLLPLYFAAESSNAEYFEKLDNFLVACLGEGVRQHYTVHLGDPKGLAKTIKQDMYQVKLHRSAHADAYSYNWQLHIPEGLQYEFEPTHENMANLALCKNDNVATLAMQLRAAFSGIVAGNVKPWAVEAVKEHGVFQLTADTHIASELNSLLKSFVAQKRMSLMDAEYKPCFEVISQ